MRTFTNEEIQVRLDHEKIRCGTESEIVGMLEEYKRLRDGGKREQLTFDALREANRFRLPQFRNRKGEPAHSEKDGSDWKLSAWSNAVCGELGEAANIIKKIERGDMTLNEARDNLANELADVQTYLDLLAFRAGINLGEATVKKFNEVSLRVKSNVFLREANADRADDLKTISEKFDAVKSTISGGLTYEQGKEIAGEQPAETPAPHRYSKDDADTAGMGSEAPGKSIDSFETPVPQPPPDEEPICVCGHNETDHLHVMLDDKKHAVNECLMRNCGCNKFSPDPQPTAEQAGEIDMLRFQAAEKWFNIAMGCTTGDAEMGLAKGCLELIAALRKRGDL